MATFELTGPDGGTYHVDAPDETAALSAFHAMNGAAPSEGSSLGGVAKSLGTGLAEGAIGLAGLPGDLYHMGLRAAGDNLTPDSNYGSNAIKKGIEGYTGEFYKPQGRAEQLANTAGQFLPAVIGGPEAMATKLATRVAAPAVASETAGALTDDNPYAKGAAALAGAVAGPMAFNRAVRAMRPGPAEATLEDIRAGSRASYQHPDVTDVRIRPDVVGNLAATIEQDLQHGANSGFRAANEPRVFNAVNELRLAEQEGRAATVADLDSVRQVLGNAAKERDAQGQLTRQAVAANRAINHINDFLPNLQQGDLLAGNAAAANTRLQAARQDWGAYKRAQNVQTLAGNAEINAASANSGANIQNATKQAFKPMLKNNAAKAVGYNPEELAALNQIVRGTWTGSIARAAGNLLGGGGGLGMLVGGAAGYHEGGLPGAIGVGLAGRGLKMVGNRSTLNAVARLDRLLRDRSPTAIRIAAQNPQIAQQLPPAATRRLQAMIAADPILSQQLPQAVPADGQ
jgi:hypothetical protein